MAVFGTAKASGTGGTPLPPSLLTSRLHPLLYIWLISLPSIQEDNRAVKNQACVSLLAAGASLSSPFVLRMCTAEGFS